MNEAIAALVDLPQAYLTSLASRIKTFPRTGPPFTEKESASHRRLAISIDAYAAQQKSRRGGFDASSKEAIKKAMLAACPDLEDYGRLPRAHSFDPFHAIHVIRPGHRDYAVLAHLVANGDLAIDLDRKAACRFVEEIAHCSGVSRLAAPEALDEAEACFAASVTESMELCELRKGHFQALLRARVAEEYSIEEIRSSPPLRSSMHLNQKNLALIDSTMQKLMRLRSIDMEKLCREELGWFRGIEEQLNAVAEACRLAAKAQRGALRKLSSTATQKPLNHKLRVRTELLCEESTAHSMDMRRLIHTLGSQVDEAFSFRLIPAHFQLPSVLSKEACQARESFRSRRLAPQATKRNAGEQRKLVDLGRRLSATIHRLAVIEEEARSVDVFWVFLEALVDHADELAKISENLENDKLLLESLAISAPAEEIATGAGQEPDNAPWPPSQDDTAPLILDAHPPSLLRLSSALPDEEWIEARFARGTFPNARSSALYHFHKHGRHAAGETFLQYAEAAQRARREFVGLVERSMTSPGSLLRLVDSRETYLLFTEQGKIISYRDRRSRRE